jgi:hypothetical protein
MRELDLTDVQAAGIVGNFGYESGLISGRQQGTSETAKPKPVMNKDGSQTTWRDRLAPVGRGSGEGRSASGSRGPRPPTRATRPP